MTVLSNFYTFDSQIIQRRPAKARGTNIGSRRPTIITIIEVKKPIVIVNYNKYMGGVDLVDQLLYKIVLRNTQMVEKLFFWRLEAAIINSYMSYKE